MSLNSFLKNLAYANDKCKSFSSKCKYLLWVYSRKITFFKKFILKIKIKIDGPIKEAVLWVRCNRGSDFFIFSEVFQHLYYEFKLPKMPRTILDLGANIGFTTLYFSKKYPRAEVACVEPIPENIILLKKNLLDNYSSATVIPKAISISDGVVTMEKAIMDYGHKIHGIKFGKNNNGEILEVEAISVPSIMRKLKWKRIGLLKIDVEGYEGILLSEKCEWLNQVDVICIECHEGFGNDELALVAKKYGFSDPQKMPGAFLLIRKNI